MKHVKCYIPEYPRPQKVRSDWQNLNGAWAFAFGEDVSEKEALTGKLPMSIRVPFSYETELSGINRHEWHETVWYAHTVSAKAGKRAILHIEGADYITTVYVNGAFAGKSKIGIFRLIRDGRGVRTQARQSHHKSDHQKYSRHFSFHHVYHLTIIYATIGGNIQKKAAALSRTAVSANYSFILNL